VTYNCVCEQDTQFKFSGLMAVVQMKVVFWVSTWRRRFCLYSHFGAMYCLHLQDD